MYFLGTIYADTYVIHRRIDQLFDKRLLERPMSIERAIHAEVIYQLAVRSFEIQLG